MSVDTSLAIHQSARAAEAATLAGSAGNYTHNAAGPVDGTNVLVQEATRPAEVSLIEGNSVMMVATSALTPHPLNATIYGDQPDEEFVEAIRRNGILQPILITGDNTIIAGHRRHAAAVSIGIKEVPVVVFNGRDDLEIREVLVEANRQRVKTNEQIGREFNVLVEVESERAKRRMATNQPAEDGMKPVPEAEKGTTRDAVAKKIGDISGVSAARAGAVVEVINKLGKSERTEKKAAEIREQLNRNIKGAFNRVVADGHIKPKRKTRSKQGQQPAQDEKQSAETAPETTSPTGAADTNSDDSGHGRALECAHSVVSFLRETETTGFSEDQRNDWKQVVEAMVTRLRELRVAIAVS